MVRQTVPRENVPPQRRQNEYPAISLVTCSFEQARYLDQAIGSVTGQGYPALEYIVIDGGSCDGSVEIIRRHEADLAYWVSEPDGGQTAALIKGFDRAAGEIMGWLCSDDVLLPGALDSVGAFFVAHPDVLAAYGDALWIDAAGHVLRPKKEMGFSRFVLLYDHNYIPQPSMFWRRSLYEAVAGLDPAFDLAMDADLWERFSARTRIAHIPRYLSCMRFYDEQKTRARRGASLDESKAIRMRNSHPLVARGPLPLALRVMARCVRIAGKALAGGYTARVPQEYMAWVSQRVAGDTAP
ncbi:MAG TPA: glycosyltransferase family 2 protein [Burkholderiales bacterium]|jgi:glycosyltransferase involved in cell wall biosynthesis|nr:glycosyltransferase family 2 protein [Burkholderiales bacterium]